MQQQQQMMLQVIRATCRIAVHDQSLYNLRDHLLYTMTGSLLASAHIIVCLLDTAQYTPHTA